jgi:hypothetical protein
MWLLILATMAAGLFAGAAIYVSAVEHPARVSCGSELAIREFGPSYHRGAVMQASLALVGLVSGLWSAWLLRDIGLVVAALLLGLVVPFTLLVILPTNNQLLDTTLDPRSAEAAALLRRWGQLHAVRTVLGSIAFVVFLVRLGFQSNAGG